MDTTVNRKLFFAKLRKLIASKREDNCSHFSQEKYSKIISEVISAKAKRSKALDYRRLKRFDVITISGKEKLIVPLQPGVTNIQYYVTNDELFNILSETHAKTGHGGRARMLKELQVKYKNITSEVVMLYINLCKSCQTKQSVPKKNIVMKPVASSKIISKCHVDLIDLQSQMDGEYKFVMICQDHLTKFIQLRPLKTKTAEEIAYHLLQIFLTFGAPSILHLDDDRKFCNQIISELCTMWKDVKIIYGKSRHSQTQCSLERTNQNIRNMLTTWMNDNNTNKWSDGLFFVQFTKNTTYHGGLRRSPYEAMFGIKPKRGIVLSSLSDEQIASIENEDQLEEIVNTSKENLSDGHTVNHISKKSIKGNLKPTKSSYQALTKQHKSTLKRAATKENLLPQATKMLRISKRKFPPAQIGDTVQIQVPDNYRESTDATNVLAVVIGIEDSDFYKLANKNGTLRELYSRNQFVICEEKLLSIDEISSQDISLREAAAEEQSYISCHCKKKCYNTKCSCKSKGLLCNLKCHNSLSCSNK